MSSAFLLDIIAAFYIILAWEADRITGQVIFWKPKPGKFLLLFRISAAHFRLNFIAWQESFSFKKTNRAHVSLLAANISSEGIP